MIIQPTRKKKYRNRMLKEKLVSDFLKTCNHMPTTHEIAKATGISQATVSRILGAKLIDSGPSPGGIDESGKELGDADYLVL